MPTCIPVPKRAGDDSAGQLDNPDSKHVKSLTSQLKNMALKASGAYRHCSPCIAGQGQIRNPVTSSVRSDSDSNRFKMSYPSTNSSSSSAAKAIMTPRVWGKEMEARLKGISSGESTPKSGSGGNRVEPIAFVEVKEPKEWVAKVDPGVLITFVSLPGGGNDLTRIRFGRDMFDKMEAQRWWLDNYEKVMELYNVQRLKLQACQRPTPLLSDHKTTKMESAEKSPPTAKMESAEESPLREPLPLDSHSSIRNSSSREADRSEDTSVSNGSEVEKEWVEQDEEGVYITIRTLVCGTRELRRVRFSREIFGEGQARIWWEENRSRIHQHYL